MKRIYLLRHGKTEPGENRSSDHERTLTDRGREDSGKTGKEIKKAGFVPERIISSDAERAMETARICAEECGYDDEILSSEELYTATQEEYLETLRSQPNGLQSIMIIGHNPTIEEFNESIMGKYQKIKTSNLVWYDVEIHTWDEMNFESTVARSGLLVP